jgi:PAS domain S-box-containing protein
MNYISDQRNLQFKLQPEEKLQLAKFLMERTIDAVFWVDRDARFLYVNDAACSLVGYSRAELLSMTMHDLNPDFSVEVWSKHWKTLKQQGSLYFESLHQPEEGQRFLVEFALTYRKYNGKEYGCILVRDISKRKQTEVALQRVNKALKCEVQERTAQLRYANEQLSREMAERRRTEAELEKSLVLLHATLESTVCGVIAFSYQEDSVKIVSFNQKFVEMWQVPDPIMMSRNPKQQLDFYSNQLKDPESFRKRLQELHSQPDTEGYDTVELKNGGIFEQHFKPLRLGEQIIGRVWSFLDITERKRTEEELLRASDARLEKQAAFQQWFAAQSQRVSTPASADTAIATTPQSIFPAYPQLTEVFHFIEANYHKPITLHDVAQVVGYSRSYLTQLVRRLTGKTVYRWIVERRMAEACSLLLETSQTVEQIAKAVGYQDTAHFFHKFRQLHGTTPQVWRKSHQTKSASQWGEST